MFIYKVCAEALWREAEGDGVFRGAPVDLADGYIHFSTEEQLAETLRRHFTGQNGLVLIEVDAERLGQKLKWEPSRGGALFPHLYDHLDVNSVRRVVPMPLTDDGKHRLPSLPL